MILQQYKIVFGGTMGAGKSSAIQALSDIPVLKTEAINTDIDAHLKFETTVGIDYGEVTLDDGLKIGLYGTPGQERFNFLWPVICNGAIGTLILIDHTVENPLQELAHYISTFQRYTDNIVVGISHVDQKLERTTSIYREWLNQQKYNFPLFFIDAREKQDVLLLIEALISKIEVNLAKISR